MTTEMPKRTHYLKFQCSIPINKTKQSVAAVQKVIDAAATHLKAVAGGAAYNVEVRAFYQDRGPTQLGIVWRDLLVVVGYDGPLTETAAQLMRERVGFEMTKGSDDAAPQKKVLLS